MQTILTRRFEEGNIVNLYTSYNEDGEQLCYLKLDTDNKIISYGPTFKESEYGEGLIIIDMVNYALEDRTDLMEDFVKSEGLK